MFGKTLLSLAEDDPSIIAISAAMISGTGLSEMLSKLPNRVYDTGIAEQHAVTFAAGAAAGGLRPFCALYSCFLQRGYDQVIHDVAIQNLPVRFCIDRAGLVGADGATHAGAYDIGMLAALPNMTVMAAADEAELARMIVTMAGLDDGPSAVRYPRGPGTGAAIDPSPQAIEIGKGRVQALEVVDVFHHRLGHDIHRLFRHAGRGDEGGTNAERGRVAIRALVHAARNGRHAVERVVSDQIVDGLTRHGHKLCIAGGGGFLDRSGRVTDRVDHRVDVAVTKLLGHLGPYVIGRTRQIIHADAERTHHHFHSGALAGAWVAYVHALTFEAFERCDAAVTAHQERKRFGMNREHCTHARKRVLGEFRRAIVCMKLPVRLGNTEFQLTRFDRVDIIDRTASRLDCATYAVVLAFAVNETADRAPSWIVNTGHTAGADGNELLSRSWHTEGHDCSDQAA